MIDAFVLDSTSLKTAAISRISEGVIPSVVAAGVPTRSPLVYQGPFASNGNALRLSVMWHWRIADSAWRPVGPKLLCTSRSRRSLADLPLATSLPSPGQPCAVAGGLLPRRRESSRTLGLLS